MGDEGPASESPPILDEDARAFVGLRGVGAGLPAGTEGSEGRGDACRKDGELL